MDTTEHLRALGEETLYIETIYLSLKIEKALRAENFNREHLLKEAEYLWKSVNTEYHSFLNFLQTHHTQAA